MVEQLMDDAVAERLHFELDHGLPRVGGAARRGGPVIEYCIQSFLDCNRTIRKLLDRVHKLLIINSLRLVSSFR